MTVTIYSLPLYLFINCIVIFKVDIDAESTLNQIIRKLLAKTMKIRIE